MKVIFSMFNFLRGGKNARRVEKCFSGRDGRECRIVYPVATVCEQAISDFGCVRMLAAACADERSRDIGTLPTDPIRRESRALICAAKKTGCFVDVKDVPGTRYTIRTGESEVRLVQKDGIYYKIKNPFAKLHLKRHCEAYVLFEHIIHNILFPDCRLEFVGVAEDYHEARIVFRQKAVRSELRPDDAHIVEVLGQMGLRQEGRYGFGNDLVLVTDVGQDGDNVLLDDDGKIRFIDPIVSFKPPLLKHLEVSLESEIAVTNLVKNLCL